MCTVCHWCFLTSSKNILKRSLSVHAVAVSQIAYSQITECPAGSGVCYFDILFSMVASGFRHSQCESMGEGSPPASSTPHQMSLTCSPDGGVNTSCNCGGFLQARTWMIIGSSLKREQPKLCNGISQQWHSWNPNFAAFNLLPCFFKLWKGRCFTMWALFLISWCQKQTSLDKTVQVKNQDTLECIFCYFKDLLIMLLHFHSITLYTLIWCICINGISL